MEQDTISNANRTSVGDDGDATDLRIDKVLNDFLGQLFLQHRRTVLRVPRGGAIISDPATVEAVLRAPDQFPKTVNLIEAAGRNRFGANGAEWELRRDLTQRYFLHAGAAANRAKIAEVYERRFSACENTEPSTIRRALLASSTEIFHHAFGCSVPIEPMLEFFDRARAVFKRLQYFSLVPANAAERAALVRDAQALAKLYQLETERSASLTALMETFRSRIGAKLDNFSPTGEFMMSFFAAIETTTATLSTAIDRLGVYTAAQKNLHAEVLADETFPRLECFVNEVLRFYPPVPLLTRLVASDTRLEELELKAGSVITVSIVGVHHHPAYWKDPDIFDCERPEFAQNSYDRRAFIPYASGIRSCGGARLAQLELIEGLKAFIRHFIVSRAGDSLSFDYAVVMRPKSLNCLKITSRPPVGRVSMENVE